MPRKPKFVEAQSFTAEQIAKLYRVPYWLIDASLPRPSWLRRPLWRLRALTWSLRAGGGEDL